MHSAFFRFAAYVSVTVLWAGFPAGAGAQDANGKKPDSSHSRQLLAQPGPTPEPTFTKSIPRQPANSFVQYGDVWGCNDGFRKLGKKCVSIFSKAGGQPANSFVQYRTIWGCDDGFKKEGNKCVSVFTKSSVSMKTKDGKSPVSSSP